MVRCPNCGQKTSGDYCQWCNYPILKGRPTRHQKAEKQQALEEFASAIELYTQHVQNHVSAIQSLSEASQELKKAVAEQNRVLIRLIELMEELTAKVELPPPEPEKAVLEEQATLEPEEVVVLKAGKIKFPPGCFRSRQQLIERTLYSSSFPKHRGSSTTGQDIKSLV